MIRIPPMPSLAELMAVEQRYSAEEFLELQSTIRPLVVFRLHPDITVVSLSQISLPAHQRVIMRVAHAGAGSNVVVGSRGTSKSSSLGVMYDMYTGTFFRSRKIITLSYTGFRGGQQIFNDAEAFLHGAWDSQRQEVPFLRASIERGHRASGDFDTPISRAQTLWIIKHDSGSTNTTLPTKDQDLIRGQRGHDLLIDEANFVDKELIDKVAIPFLTLTGDVEHGGANALPNRVFYISTVDYSWRPFQKRIEAARAGIQRDYDAYEALQRGDWNAYYRLEDEGLHEHSFVQVDYTDTLIRRYVTNREGKHFEVKWPDPKISKMLDRRGIPFTTRRPDGAMDRRGPPVEYYKIWHVDKAFIERNLRDGSADEASWKAENRNIVESAQGDVFSTSLIDQVTFFGDRCLLAYGRCGEGWKTAYVSDERDYVPTVMWRCTDPCVIGVDYAPFSDFCAFVVIRIGPLATGDFDPMTGRGQTQWSNVIWAEQHRKLTHAEATEKIRALAERYRLVWFDDMAVDDPWERCRAIGLDVLGGGSGIRDGLARIDQEVLLLGETRIYDPFDTDERIAAFTKDDRALPALDCITPSAPLNERLVEYMKGQMESGRLYLPKFFDQSQRPLNDPALNIGFDHTKILAHQLRKIRQRPTQQYRQFYMEGDKAQDRNKKDLFSAFLYAGKQLRAHIIRQSQIDNTPPPTVARMGGIGGTYGRRAPGARA